MSTRTRGSWLLAALGAAAIWITGGAAQADIVFYGVTDTNLLQFNMTTQAVSVVAPLFFLACFGLPGAVAYRAINTLDAMIGYRGRYEWLGKAAARLDDLANLVPARLSVLFLFAAGSGSRRLGAALGVWSRDHARTESPNAGHPMAMAAGLLGVRLDKPGHYVLGPELPVPTRADLARGVALVRRAGLLPLAAAGFVDADVK